MSWFQAARLLELMLFVSLAGVGAVQWRRLRSEASSWLARTFVVISGAVLVGSVLSDDPTRTASDQGLMRAALVLLVLFPYCLYRFGASFDRWARRPQGVARVVTAVLVGACAAVPYVPGPTAPVPPWFLAFSIGLVVAWTGLSMLSAAGLWRAGHGQPAVVRHRMRMLATAAVALNVALFFALDRGPRSSMGVDLFTQVLVVTSATMFLLAFAPPRWLRTVWRREELECLRPAEAALMVARSSGEVASILLPHAARLVGAGSAVLTGPDGDVVAWHGLGEAEAVDLAARGRAADPAAFGHVVTVAVGRHRLAVGATPATPLFGRDELGVLERFGHLAGLAIDRADLMDRDEAARRVLADREAQLAEAQRTARLGSYSWDLVTDEVSWSAEMHRLLGFVPGEVEQFGRAFASRLHPEDAAAVHEAWEAACRGEPEGSMEFRIVLPDGTVRWIHGRVGGVQRSDGLAVRLVGTMQDVTERRASEEAVSFQALHDSLTGLPNRRLFLDRLAHALAARGRRSTGLAVLFLDVDRFKWLNDSLGHAAGDELLVQVAARLEACLRPGDTVARFGGDEFVILCEDLPSEKACERVARRFASEIARPVVVAGEETMVTVSIGIAYSPESSSEDTAETLLRDADTAMYQAKDHGRDRFETFDAETRQLAVARHETANALRRGMERGELVVHYQPQVDLTTGRVWGVEALVRWRHPERGLLAPADFVPLAEETGLIVPLGVRVLTEACLQVQAWQPQDGAAPPLAVCVNLSARQLLAADLCDVVESALTSSGLDPALLCLEITESVLLADGAASARALQRLKALGVRVGVDDFGTGFSSLTYLKRFPVDVLKIDRSFVEGLGNNAEDRAIVASIVGLARAFGLTTIAEGVETVGQLDELRSLGCERGQGYLWSAALPPADAERWIAAHAGRSATAPARRLSLVPGTRGADRHRVLIVDDDPAVRRLLRILFETDDGFEVVGEADDGREAAALARHVAPDLVLLDLAMPGMGGLEALPLILAAAPGAKVVVLSALDGADMASEAARQGASAFLAKGGDPARLLALLGPLLATA